MIPESFPADTIVPGAKRIATVFLFNFLIGHRVRKRDWLTCRDPEYNTPAPATSIQSGLLKSADILRDTTAKGVRMMPRILVVEDSPTQATHIRLVLESAGFDVDTAPDGPAALDWLRDTGFDLVLSDVLM